MLVSCLVAFVVVDELKVVHIHDDNGKIRIPALCYLDVHLLLELQIRMPVPGSCQGIDVGLSLGLGEAPCVFLLLAHLGVDVVHTHDEARAFFLNKHCGLKLHMDGLFIHHDAVAQAEHSVFQNIVYDIFLGKDLKEHLSVIRVAELGSRLPCGLKEILSFLGKREVLIAFGCTEFAVMIGLGVNNVDTDEVACKNIESLVSNLLFLHPLGFLALLHLFINVSDSDYDEALVVLHTGHSHADVDRFSLHHQTVCDYEVVVMIQSLGKVLAIQGVHKGSTVIRVHIPAGFHLEFFKELSALSGLCQKTVLTMGAVLHKVLGFKIHVVKTDIAVNQ